MIQGYDILRQNRPWTFAQLTQYVPNRNEDQVRNKLGILLKRANQKREK